MIDFIRHMLRPRAIRAWWRLGSTFELAMFSHTFNELRWASHREMMGRIRET